MTSPVVGRSPQRRHATYSERVRDAGRRNIFKAGAIRLALPMLLLATVLATLLGGPAFTVVPTALSLLVWAAIVLPLETVLPAIALLLLGVNNPSGVPANGEADWILNPIGELLYTNLPIKVAIADLLIVLLVFRAVAILLISERVNGRSTRPPRPFVQACVAATMAIVALEFWGVFVNEGNFQQSLWQLRVPLLLPSLALAVTAGPTDVMFRRIRYAVFAAGSIKAFEAIWIGYVRGYASSETGAYVTTHSDTVLWSTCIFFLLAMWFETRKKRDLLLLIFLSVPIFVAIVANNRRVAWVAVFAGTFFIVSIAHRGVKRQIARYISFTWPLLVVYVVIGFSSKSANPVFLPVSKIASVTTAKDTSADTRDIENYNLLITVRSKPVLGYGFGHEYNEFVKAYDISKSFEQYRYLPHNSFLGFWAFNGLFGSALYFVLPVVAVFYATSARRNSAVPGRRAAGAWSVCVTITYFFQAWADVGMQDWTTMICTGLAYGMAGSLGRAVAEEALPPVVQPVYEYVEDDELRSELRQDVRPAVHGVYELVPALGALGSADTTEDRFLLNETALQPMASPTAHRVPEALEFRKTIE